MPQIRDFDGNDFGAGTDWKRIGTVDVEGDDDLEALFVNPTLGRWATVGIAEDGKIYMENHNWGGDTRVVGTYIDPLVKLGVVVAGGEFDSQVRFAADLKANNIGQILDAGDYNHDGLQEVYFPVADGSAYLHAYMHADGNIQYANYQVADQVKDYLGDNGYTAAYWDTWL
jgi:serralysin